MKMDKEFEIRTYTKRQLALMYFPESHPRTAVNRLTLWIRRCTPLWQQLESMGYSSSCKAYSPREMRAIVNFLGPP